MYGGICEWWYEGAPRDDTYRGHPADEPLDVPPDDDHRGPARQIHLRTRLAVGLLIARRGRTKASNGPTRASTR